MEPVTALYLINATLLLLHEIDSAHEKEWEILHLPGGIGGFLVMHVPLILVLFYGALEIAQASPAGLVLGIVTGAGGLVPWLVHRVLVRREGRFESVVSRSIIYANVLTGLLTAGLSLRLSQG